MTRSSPVSTIVGSEHGLDYSEKELGSPLGPPIDQPRGRQQNHRQEVRVDANGSTGHQGLRPLVNDDRAVYASDLELSNPLQRLSSRVSTLSNHQLEELVRHLSRRPTYLTSHGDDDIDVENEEEISRLLAEIFDREEMKEKHVGVLFRNFTVIGTGVGARVAPTVGDMLMGPITLAKKVLGKQAKGGNSQRTLINSFDGCVRDGEMLLVLGQPGSGCTTFLKTLANQRNGYAKITGDVSYGGIGWEEMLKKYRGEVVYNSEDDLHYATLSVAQTLRFALKTRTPVQRPKGETARNYQDKFLDILGKIFGISHTFSTKVGDAMVRGVSGGEKKRVSIAEVFVNRAPVGCWDNSTRGLDASTAVEYCRSLRVLTNIAKVSTVVTIYQAGEQLYNFFDKVLLVHEGKCIFYGRSEKAKRYFENLGFECTDRQTTADFLTSITDPESRTIREGENPPTTSTDLERAYRQSGEYQATLADMDDYEQSARNAHLDESFKEAKEKTKGKRRGVYALPYWKQVQYCTIRQYQINMGDKFSLVGKNASAIFQALIIGSLFYKQQATTNGAFTRGGTLFFALLFNALLALAELTLAFSSRPILMKHKSFTLYRPSAYALAQVVADVPVIFVQIACFDIVLYFLSGLSRTASQFFINFLFLYFSTMSMYAFFRMLGSLVPSLDAATALSGLSVQALIVYAGYIIPKPSMHPWFVWIYYLNPLAYAFEALMTNEFYGLQLQCVPPFLVPFGAPGQYPNQGCAIAGSSPNSLIVNGSDYLFASFEYTRAHLWRNLGIIILFWLFFVFMTCVGTEMQKPFADGGSTTVYKKGGVPKATAQAMETGKIYDEEDLIREKTSRSHGPDVDGSDRMNNFEKSETIFTWDNVCYTVPDPSGKGQKLLLDHVAGWVKPGKLTALVGASGAGKTTLLNTLAQRQSTGVISGDMLVDGRPLPISFQRSTGYCEQMDVHEPTASVREALQFSALLRQPKETPIAEKYEYVEEIIKLLEMEDIAEALIGEVGQGLSVEQRKRVTIGVELASKPSLLLFLDEPTSGLDSQSAWNIVRFLRKLAGAGQALLVTIHQPSAVLFEQFDNLLLLAPGGKTIYFGELGAGCHTMIDYFESNGSDKIPKTANPAEWVLDVVGAGGGIGAAKAKKDWVQLWKDSDENKNVRKELDKIMAERGNIQNKYEKDTREYAMPIPTQIYAVTKRIFISYWRTPQYAVGKIMLHITTGLFNCFTFFQLGSSIQDQQNKLFSLFIVLTIAPPLIQQCQPRYIAARSLFTGREKQSKIYHYTAFVTGSVLVEIPYSIVAGTIFFFCWYYGPGFPRDAGRAGVVWMFLMLFEIYYITLGIAIAAMAPSVFFASLLVPTFFTFIIAFCGVLSPPAAMPYFWRSWMYPLTPFHYLLEAFLTLVEHLQPIRCSPNEFGIFTPANGQTCAQYADSFVQQAGGYFLDPAATNSCSYCQYANGDDYTRGLNVFWTHLWRNYGIFWGFIVFNIIMIYVITWAYTGGFKRIVGLFGRKHKVSGIDPERHGQSDAKGTSSNVHRP